MSILQEICDVKARHIEIQKSIISLPEIQERAIHAEPPRGFLKSLQNSPGIAVIAEVKKASPSKGVIRENFDPVEIARSYEEAGAACLSVLTDEPYFQGSDQYLIYVHKNTGLPILRKDFMIDRYQIYESRALNADCVLLIMAALTDRQASELNLLSQMLGMDVLVEVHDEEELIRALKLMPTMIGVNNRNLKTMEVSLETSHRLSPLIPDSILRISESGIATQGDIFALQSAGFGAFLIGEAFMRQTDEGAALKGFLTQNGN
ncbi:MAG: indole-3-glycerol phosphate synthase TrpC [Alphaproteobacteria bacterium]